MTKQEKIQEAYAEYWEEMKPYIDENGWFSCESFWLCNLTYDELSSKILFFIDRNDDTIRPLSIEGIENNNGWINIESEGDLPKIEGKYWTIRKNGIIIEECFYNFHSMSLINFYNITHYRPIVHSKNPIY